MIIGTILDFMFFRSEIFLRNYRKYAYWISIATNFGTVIVDAAALIYNMSNIIEQIENLCLKHLTSQQSRTIYSLAK